jgi:hypothetical protein
MCAAFARVSAKCKFFRLAVAQDREGGEHGEGDDAEDEDVRVGDWTGVEAALRTSGRLIRCMWKV